ncbi:RNA 2'-phosphotransferase [Ralstonia pseudosolanacearum]
MSPHHMNATNKQLDEVSKYLSYILRHKPEAIDLQLDIEGWADIESLISGSIKKGKSIDRETIQSVVANNEKKRFSISDDGKRIRAAQGHSTSTVRRNYQEKNPPEFLYHGTATHFLESILETGLKSGSRHHVHLSQDILTSIAVGKRHGKPITLIIESQKMCELGFKFFLTENNVWLTDSVPPEFIKILK